MLVNKVYEKWYINSILTCILHATPTYIHTYGQTPEGSAVAKCGSYYPECDRDADVVQSLNIALIYKKTCSLHLICFK